MVLNGFSLRACILPSRAPNAGVKMESAPLRRGGLHRPRPSRGTRAARRGLPTRPPPRRPASPRARGGAPRVSARAPSPTSYAPEDAHSARGLDGGARRGYCVELGGRGASSHCLQTKVRVFPKGGLSAGEPYAWPGSSTSADRSRQMEDSTTPHGSNCKGAKILTSSEIHWTTCLPKNRRTPKGPLTPLEDLATLPRDTV